MAAITAACAIWGVSPLFFRLLQEVPRLELLAHRAIWSVAIFGTVVLAQGRGRELARLLGRGRILRVAAAGLLVAGNWFCFLLAVQWGEVRQSSLGYYIFPLAAVALGVLLLGERPSALQAAAVALAAAGVGVMTWAAGGLPWIALALALSFAAYGLLKKTLAAPPLLSVTAEILLLVPPALLWLALVHAGLAGGAGAVFGREAGLSALLVLSGVMTALPLMLFSYGARRLSLGATGLVQYVNPTLQGLVAVLILGEPVGPAGAVAFALIWAAIALYSGAALGREKAARRAAASAGTSSATPM